MKKWAVALALVASVLLCTSGAWAGSGRIRNAGTNQNVLDMTVFFDDTTTAANELVAKWQQNLNKTHALLWKATNGLLRLGRVRYGTHKGLKSRADLVVAYTGHACANCPGLGQSGTSINMFTKEDANEEIVTVHEMGHYIFTLGDEYMSNVYGKDASGAVVVTQKGNKEISFCPVKVGTANANQDCLMYYNYQPNILFCNDDHVGKGDGATAGSYWISDQQSSNGCSCWQTIGKFFSYTVPAGKIAHPDAVPDAPAFEAAPPEVAFGVLIQGDLPQADLDKGKAGAKSALKGLRLKGDAGLPPASNGDHMYVGTAGTTWTALVQDSDLTDQTVRDAAFTAVDGLTTSQTAANLEASISALATAMAQGSSQAMSRTILVVSSGSATAFSQALINQLKQADIQVDAVFVWAGDQAAYDNMNALTTATGGSISTVDQTATKSWRALKGTRASLKANTRMNTKAEEEETADDEAEDSTDGALGIGTIADFNGTLTPGTRINHSLVVDELNDEIIIRLSSRLGGQLTMTLTDPNGNPIDLANPPANITVDPWEAETQTLEVTISEPLKGTYIAGVDGANAAAYELKLNQVGESMGMSPQEDGGGTTFPASALLQLTVEGTQRVMGCQVTARVGCPDGTVMNVTLYDDGDAVHGDPLANDGVYSNYLPEYRGVGAYQVLYTINNVNGQYTNNRIGGDRSERNGAREAGPIGPAPVFTRMVNGRLFLSDPTGSGGRGKALVPPLNLALSSDAPGQIKVGWTDPNMGTAMTVVQRSTSRDSGFVSIATVSAGQTTYTDRLSTSTTYFYRLVAQAGTGTSSPSGVSSFDLSAASAVQAASTTTGGLKGYGGGGGCFIATAAYGSYLDPHVSSLRRFRDNVLASNGLGRAFISLYERVSPPLAGYIADHTWARVTARVVLTPIVLLVSYPLACLTVILAMAAWWVRRRRLAGAARA